jgi:hypothetical protein
MGNVRGFQPAVRITEQPAVMLVVAQNLRVQMFKHTDAQGHFISPMLGCSGMNGNAACVSAFNFPGRRGMAN